jgi:hypothetical protein
MAARPRRTTVQSPAPRLLECRRSARQEAWTGAFLNQHGVDICLLSETFLNTSQALRLANYVCHRTDKPTMGGGTAILVRRGMVHLCPSWHWPTWRLPPSKSYWPAYRWNRLKVSWRGKPPSTATRQIAKAKGDRGQQASRSHRPRWPSRLNELRSALFSRAPFGYPEWGFRDFPQL